MLVIKHILMFPLFHLFIKPLIKRNYRLRREGKLPDEWYWADKFAVEHGYAVDFNGKTTNIIWKSKDDVRKLYARGK